MSQSIDAGTRAWSVAAFERFWSNPDRDVDAVPEVITPDIVGHWPGRERPVRGKAEYMGCIRSLVAALPDMRLAVAEHAVNGDAVFIHWLMIGTGERGPFELHGIDRVRLRNGQVCENLVMFDTNAFQARTGKAIPWI